LILSVALCGADQITEHAGPRCFYAGKTNQCHGKTNQSTTPSGTN